jgi:lysophospholipase L1-like esterase
VLAGVSMSVPATAQGRGTWAAAWGASPVVGSEIPFSPNCQAGRGLTDQTVRNVLFASTGGTAVRVRLSNVFGARALQVGRATVAVQAADARPVPGTLRTLKFAGQSAVTVVAGAQALSDPVDLTVAPLSKLLVSVYVPGPTGPVTNHPFTAQGNFIATGDRTLSESTADFTDSPCWMLVDGVDVRTTAPVVGSVVALGDSITDTANTTGNADRRWPDFLSRRLAARPGPRLSVVNAGLGGNRVLAPRDGEPYWGVPALARLHRDVFTQTGVRAVILFEGVNDIGFSATAPELIAAYQQIIAQTRAQGLRIYGATITQFKGSFIENEQRMESWRQINHWIRTSGAFDGVFDFARATADPADPEALNPAYDSGDHLHPNDAGCEAIANAVDLRRLLVAAH